MAIRNVVFDVGNVIVKWAPQDIAQLTLVREKRVPSWQRLYLKVSSGAI